MGFKANKSFADLKTNDDNYKSMFDNLRADDLTFENKKYVKQDKPAKIRFIGPVLPIYQHWFKTPTGGNAPPKICLAYDPDLESFNNPYNIVDLTTGEPTGKTFEADKYRCPACSMGDKSRSAFIVNIINRKLQEEGRPLKECIQLISIGSNMLKSLKGMIATHDNVYPQDPERGYDTAITVDTGPKGKTYSLQYVDRVALSEKEQNAKIHDLGAVWESFVGIPLLTYIRDLVYKSQCMDPEFGIELIDHYKSIGVIATKDANVVAKGLRTRAEKLRGSSADDDEDSDSKPTKSNKKPIDDDDDEIPAKKSSKKDVDDEGMSPAKPTKKPVVDDDEDDLPPPSTKKKPIVDDDEEDDAPPPKKKPVVDDEDEDETPPPKKKPVIDDDDEEDIVSGDDDEDNDLTPPSKTPPKSKLP